MAKDFCKKIDKPYILVFNVKPVKSLIDFAEKLSKKTEIPVVYITDNPQKKRKNFTYVSAPTVEEFLGYFANADYTVTNSFHGTAFSVIFTKICLLNMKQQKDLITVQKSSSDNRHKPRN